ncbi:hypothetical protein OQA88_11973 [Cercophora sp. LCS_1]
MTVTSSAVGLENLKLPKITLKGTQETLFITLFGRYLDSLRKDPILNDQLVGPILKQVDYDFAKLGVGEGTACSIATRSRQFDIWAQDFLDKHKLATVVHMACGLDTRAHRLKWGSQVRWIDVDLPEVVELRKQLVAPPKWYMVDYYLVAGSAIDANFIKSLPNERPTLIIMEGLSIYLKPEEGKKMMVEYAKHFREGEILMDSVNSLTLSLQRIFAYVRNFSSPLLWAIDEPKEMEKLHWKLKLEEAKPLCTLNTISRFPLGPRIFMWISSLFSATRNTVRYLRYSYSIEY